MQYYFGNENRRTFFERVHKFLCPYHEGPILIARAYQDAKTGFDGILRKSGERYFEHCRWVAIILMDLAGVTDWNELAAALLHDNIEDLKKKGWTYRRIADRYNLQVAQYVRALSMPNRRFKSREARMEAYHLQIFNGPVAVKRIKLADRLHNLVTCESLPALAQMRMVEETELQYIPLARKLGVLYSELQSACDEVRLRLSGTVKKQVKLMP